MTNVAKTLVSSRKNAFPATVPKTRTTTRPAARLIGVTVGRWSFLGMSQSYQKPRNFLGESILLGEAWRRGPELNRRIELLQSSALPLGYRAECSKSR